MKRERKRRQLRLHNDLVEEIIDLWRTHAHLERKRLELWREVGPAEVQALSRLSLPRECRKVREEELAGTGLEYGEDALRECVERLDVGDAPHALAVRQQLLPVRAFRVLDLHGNGNGKRTDV